MRIVISALLITFGGALLLYTLRSLPHIQSLKACYDAVNLLYDDTGKIVRRTTAEQECQKGQDILTKGVSCFSKAEEDMDVSATELDWFHQIARFMTRSQRSLEESVTEHNQSCTSIYHKVILQTDEYYPMP